MMATRSIAGLLVLVVAACCGPAQRRVDYRAPALAADPEIATPVERPRPPSGPLVDLDFTQAPQVGAALQTLLGTEPKLFASSPDPAGCGTAVGALAACTLDGCWQPLAIVDECLRRAQHDPAALVALDALDRRADFKAFDIAAGGAGGKNESAIASAGAATSLEGMLIAGLADFVVSRAQQELIDHVTRTFGAQVCARDVLGVQVATYFRETCRLLRGDGLVLDASLKQIGSAFQHALTHDVENLLPALLNQAAGALERSGWGPTATELVKLATAAAGAEATPRAVFAVGVTLPCQADQAYLCVVRWASRVGLVVIDTPCGAPIDASCLDGWHRALDAATRDDAVLRAWIEATGFSVEHAAVDQLLAAVAALVRDRPADGRRLLSDVVGVLRLVVGLAVPADRRDQGLALLARLEHAAVRWADLALVAYHAVRATASGADVERAVIAAAQQATCASPSDDVGCGVRLAGTLAPILLEVGVSLERPSPAAVRKVVHRLALAIAADPPLLAWTKARLHLDPAHVDEVSGELTALVERLAAALAQLEQAIKTARGAKTADERRATAIAVVSAAANFARVVVEVGVADPVERARAERIIEHVVEAGTAAIDRKPAGFLAALYALSTDLGAAPPLPERIRKYLPLVTSLTSATSAAEVSAALEKFAAPVGSYRGKYQPGFHVTLSAGLGGDFGYERGVDVPRSRHAGMFAPVGFDLTWGGCNACGLLLSIVDLGALTASRLDDAAGDATTTQDPRFVQVFSPGAYFRVGLAPKVLGPAFVGAGVSAIPGLRRDGDGESAVIYRAIAFVAVDVTLFSP